MMTTVSNTKILRVMSILLFGAMVAATIGCGDTETKSPGKNTSPGVVHNNTPKSPEDVEDGSVSLVSAEIFVDENNDFYTYLAHLMGKTINGTKLHFANNIQLKNESSSPQTAFVKLSVQGYSQEVQQRVDLGANETKTINPMDPTFDFSQLYGVTSAVNANIQISVYQDDRLVDLRTESISIDPVNRVRWALNEGGQIVDFRPFAVTLVTPEDRGHEIQKLLTEAAQYTPSGAMVGYQDGTEESVIYQAKAVYDAIKARNIVYTHVPGSFFDGAQYVKLPAQSLRTGSANCIDGTLVFASAFEALGMEPIIIFMSNHALIALRTAPGKNERALFIETTLVGNASFSDAIVAGENKVYFHYEQQDPQYLELDLIALRQLGFTPVNL